jgi:hypothetical protein
MFVLVCTIAMENNLAHYDQATQSVAETPGDHNVHSVKVVRERMRGADQPQIVLTQMRYSSKHN